MTRRERLERRAERREEWAQGRADKARSLRNATPESIRRDWAFITQPGRIPERERMNRRDAKAVEHDHMAAHHRTRAAGLRDQLNRSIYSDDVDAVERLRERIAGLDAKRKRNTAVNRAWRKAGKPTADDRDGWERVATTLGVPLDSLQGARLNLARDPLDRAPFPPYVNQNLGNRIRTARQRIEAIEAAAVKTTEAAQAGGVVVQDTSGGFCTVTFAEKPDRSILTALKAAGFRWSRPSWHGKRADLPECVQ